MKFDNLLRAVSGGNHDPETVGDLARESLIAGEEEAALPLIQRQADAQRSARLWQWAGLLQRSIDEHENALRSLERAGALAPGDASIAHGRARVALEAGLPAVELFERARSLAPQDGDVQIGLAAARMAQGEGEDAALELAEILERAPSWLAGHEQLAQLRSTLGHRDRATASVERALAKLPSHGPLWTTLFGLRLKAEQYEALASDVGRARAAGVGQSVLQPYDAICASELDDSIHPAPLFADASPGSDNILGIWRIRHLLRVGAVDEALEIIDRELASERAPLIWPYASLAWRLAGDPRSDWLEADSRFVSIIDLTPDLPPLKDLASLLRSLHVAKAEYLDQSVRGGTQTDGPLLSRIERPIRELREAIVKAVERYIAQLPAADPRHPLLAPRRDRRIRFSGSWSVRLRRQGRHSNHVHPRGWISSALYVALPEREPTEPGDAGWLTLGEPQAELRIPLPALKEIQPRVGQLVLFPSWMWHGTVPFAGGERMTVAFDVRVPN